MKKEKKIEDWEKRFIKKYGRQDKELGLILTIEDPGEALFHVEELIGIVKREKDKEWVEEIILKEKHCPTHKIPQKDCYFCWKCLGWNAYYLEALKKSAQLKCQKKQKRK